MKKTYLVVHLTSDLVDFFVHLFAEKLLAGETNQASVFLLAYANE